ncbi:MAG TPA: polysaccharide deacetylase family protein [Polyangia bacterium]
MLLLPTLGGGGESDASQPRRLRDAGAARSELGGAEPRAPEAPVSLWSPGHGPHTKFQPASGPRELLLSFDDGPDLKGTPLILEELDRRGLKAVFFVTGWRFAGQRPEDLARRDLVRKIAAHGHLIANHTFTHHDLCRNPDERDAEIDSNAALIEATTGIKPLLFRAPYGGFCPSLEAALTAREVPDVGWNLDPQDWKNHREEDVFNYLVGKVSRMHGRGILLLHDTHLASVRALPHFLDWLARENARAVDEGKPPVTIIDYGVLVPRRPVAASGVERVVRDLVAEVGAPLARLWR